MITKTYIPGKPRNKKLTNVTSGAASVGKTEFNQVAGSSHEHPNKGILDRITEDTLNATLRDILTSIDDSIEPSDDNLMSSLRVLAEILKNNEDLKEVFLSKVEPDTAQGLITFLSGLNSKEIATLEKGSNVGNYSPGLFGSGGTFRMNNGVSELEVDKLLVRMRAEFFSVLIHQAKHIGGELIISAADMICNKVEEFSSFYRCYFDRGENNEVNNLFTNQDRARCQVFTGSGQKFYWRKVVAVGSDYIELSKTDTSPGANDIPEVGDHIFQLGSDDPERQSAIIISSVGADAPSWKQYEGIDSFSLEGKETTVFSSKGNRIQGKTVFTSGGSNLDDYLDSTAQDIQDAQAAANAAALKAQQAIEDAEANVTLINTEVGKLQAQIDGEVSNWFYPYSPTLANYPASDWTTNEIKDRHIGDTFTNTQTFVDNETTPDAGKSWRFVKNGSTYSWTVIADSDAVLALQKAAQAQSTADGKSTTFLVQPSNYSVGDMWVLNADRTINGTAYKQGEILTATQDSTTFVEAHWLKRVRYTDQDAIDKTVNELEIGGRNLLIRSTLIKDRYLDQSTGNLATFAGLYTTDFIEVAGGADYTFFAKKNATNNPYQSFRLAYYDINKTFLSGLIFSQADEIYRIKTPINAAFIRFSNGGGSGYTRLIDGEFKVEKGTKATGWQLAPEDIQAEMDSAKQEALSAASDAQSTADSLKNFTDTAFRDGIIDRSESVAIEKYKNSLNEAMSKAEASYNKVYTNTYLEGAAKTSLLNAKVNLWGQRDTLLSAINTAISGGATTPAQKTAVDNAFTSFNNLMSAFQSALEEANKAIQAKLDSLSTEKVNNLEIGGKNLILNTSNIWGTKTIASFGAQLKYIPINGDWRGKIVTHSFEVKDIPEGESVRIRIDFYRPDNTYITPHYGNIINLAGKSFVSYIVPTDTQYDRIRARIMPVNYTSDYNVLFRCEKLEFGNKPTDWSPAPEDIQAEIDSAKQEALTAANTVQTNVDNLNTYMEGVFKDGLIDEAEAKAIEKYLNTINETMAKAEASYNKVYANTYLEGDPKTALLNAKINLWGQRDTLLTAVNTAIAGGQTTPAQKTAVDNAFTSFNSLMSAFQSALEEANKAIQNKLKSYADAAQDTADDAAAEAADALAKANTSKAITDKFKTTINGGLINTVMMLLRDLNSVIETSGISGIQGELRNNPAFWAGGTYAQAFALIEFLSKMSAGTTPSSGEYEGLAKITMLHNGAAKVGDFIIEESGRIVMIDPATGKPRLMFTVYNLPLIADLMSGVAFGDSANIGAGSTSTSQVLSGIMTIDKTGAIATFSGSTLNISAAGQRPNDGITPYSYATATLWLRRGSSRSEVIASVSVSFTEDDNLLKSNQYVIPQYSFPLGSPAAYTFELVVTSGGLVSSALATSSAFTFSWSFVQQDVRYQQYGLDGMMFFYSNHHFHFTEGGGLDGRALPDKWNAPGVLAAGSSTSGGVQSNVWGAKSNAGGITIISGGFRVPLSNMSHNKYVVQITPHTNTTFRVGTKTNAYFEIFGTGGFDYVVIGNNYNT